MFMEYADLPNKLSDKILEVSTKFIGTLHLIYDRLTVNLILPLLQRHTPIGNNTKLLSYAEDILQGLKYVHNEGIIHSDIKLENILHTSSDVAEELPIAKLCDFGLSHKMNNDGKATALVKCGTMGYMAPEL